MKSHKEDSSAMVKRFLRPVVIGAVVGALCCTLVLIIMAAIVASQDIPKAVITPMAIVAGAAGSFFGGFTAARIAKERGLLIGGACGLLLFILVVIVGFAFLKEIRGAYILVKLAVMLICSAVGGVIGVNLRKRR